LSPSRASVSTLPPRRPRQRPRGRGCEPWVELLVIRCDERWRRNGLHSCENVKYD
jgi:hypothetical protein